jgi:hypothetical protein
LVTLLDEYLEEKPEKKEKKSKKTKERTSSVGKSKDVHNKRKIVKDDNAPKKPLTAFMLYCRQRREEMKIQEPRIIIKC